MNKLKTLAFFYLFLFSISVILHSCCTDPEQVTLVAGGDITFRDQYVPISDVLTDVLIGQPFSMEASIELLFASNFISPAIMTSAYGLSCEREYQNSMLDDTLMLTCDSDFRYNGETIKAGQNFSDLNGVFVSIYTTSIFINVTQDFIDNVEFTNGSEGTILIAIQ